MQNTILALAESIQNKQPVVLATVVGIGGASPARPGAQIELLNKEIV